MYVQLYILLVGNDEIVIWKGQMLRPSEEIKKVKIIFQSVILLTSEKVVYQIARHFWQWNGTHAILRKCKKKWLNTSNVNSFISMWTFIYHFHIFIFIIISNTISKSMSLRVLHSRASYVIQKMIGIRKILNNNQFHNSIGLQKIDHFNSLHIPQFSILFFSETV